MKQLCDLQTKIESINASDNSRMKLEEAFIVAKSKIVKLLKKNRGSVSMELSFKMLLLLVILVLGCPL